MGKIQKVSITNLGTGKKNVSYVDVENVKKEIESGKIPISNIPKAAIHGAGTASVINKIIPKIYLDLQSNSMYQLSQQLKDNIHQSTWQTLDIGQTMFKLNQSITKVSPLFNINLPNITNPFYETALKLKTVYEEHEIWEKKNKKKKHHSTKARRVNPLGKELITSNRILGYVCYYTGFFTNNDINALLQKLGISVNNNIIKEIGRFRNDLKNVLQMCFDNKYSTRKIITQILIFSNSYEVLQHLNLKGKRQLKDDIKKLNNLVKNII